MKFELTEEQKLVLENVKPKLIVSASAGSGKTTTIIDYIYELARQRVPFSRLLVLTYTRAAAAEMKDRLLAKMEESAKDEWMLDQIDELATSDISTIHAFLEKSIKRNINLLPIGEGFTIADENKIGDIKARALKSAEEKMLQEDKEEYEKLCFSLRREKNIIAEMVEAVSFHLSVQPDPILALHTYYDNQKQLFTQAESYINSNLVKEGKRICSSLEKIQLCIAEEDKYFDYINGIKNIFISLKEENSLRENLTLLSASTLGRKPAGEREDFDYKALLRTIKRAKNLISKYTSLDLMANIWEENPPIIKGIYKLTEKYLEECQRIKVEENIIDFSDIEKYSIELLENNAVMEELASCYDVIFIDEYQDVNPVQEKIIKKLAKSTKFVAVGDPKQGIYGFRNASSEIMKGDILNFSQDGEGNVVYLKNNFRSDPKILNFVNKVFEKTMQENTAGIDYQGTSMLKGRGYFEESSFPAVRIDVAEKKSSSKRKKEEIYNLLDHKLSADNNCKLEGEIVAERITELLKGKIYDSRKGILRDVEYSDIAILTRGRGEVVDSVHASLAKRKIPVVSAIGREISNPEIDVLFNLFSICIDEKNDVALASVMASKLGGYSLEELVEIRGKEKSFYEAAILSEKAQPFFEMLGEFKQLIQIKGAKFALEELFAKKDYYAYLLCKENGENLKYEIEKLLEFLQAEDLAYDTAAIVEAIKENRAQIKGSQSGVEKAITLSTIHSSKGLEYPIVVLIGMGRNITSTVSKSYAINNQFGLGTYQYDLEKDRKDKSLILEAIRQANFRKEFVDEMMILYVALTRAKNHLYIIGTQEIDGTESISEAEEIFDKKSFLEIILSSIGVEKFILNKQTFEEDGLEINYISDMDYIQENEPELISTSDENMIKQTEQYLNFVYPNLLATQTRYKNSVSGLNKVEALAESFAGGSGNLDVGIAYHDALKVLDFSSIEKAEDINLGDLQGQELIDKSLLFKNISLLKNLVLGKKLIKEKPFTMRFPACQLMPTDLKDEIMVQGIIDLLAVGEKNILIDYKYTNEKNPEKIINKYKTQLNLYEKAIKNGLNINIDEIYLLSLKYVQLIKLK